LLGIRAALIFVYAPQHEAVWRTTSKVTGVVGASKNLRVANHVSTPAGFSIGTACSIFILSQKLYVLQTVKGIISLNSMV
jgi:hypothetical protein